MTWRLKFDNWNSCALDEFAIETWHLFYSSHSHIDNFYPTSIKKKLPQFSSSSFISHARSANDDRKTLIRENWERKFFSFSSKHLIYYRNSRERKRDGSDILKGSTWSDKLWYFLVFTMKLLVCFLNMLESNFFSKIMMRWNSVICWIYYFLK